MPFLRCSEAVIISLSFLSGFQGDYKLIAERREKLRAKTDTEMPSFSLAFS
jgi:hypothetical protein